MWVTKITQAITTLKASISDSKVIVKSISLPKLILQDILIKSLSRMNLDTCVRRMSRNRAADIIHFIQWTSLTTFSRFPTFFEINPFACQFYANLIHLHRSYVLTYWMQFVLT